MGAGELLALTEGGVDNAKIVERHGRHPLWFAAHLAWPNKKALAPIAGDERLARGTTPLRRTLAGTTSIRTARERAIRQPGNGGCGLPWETTGTAYLDSQPVRAARSGCGSEGFFDDIIGFRIAATRTLWHPLRRLLVLVMADRRSSVGRTLPKLTGPVKRRALELIADGAMDQARMGHIGQRHRGRTVGRRQRHLAVVEQVG